MRVVEKEVDDFFTSLVRLNGGDFFGVLTDRI